LSWIRQQNIRLQNPLLKPAWNQSPIVEANELDTHIKKLLPPQPARQLRLSIQNPATMKIMSLSLRPALPLSKPRHM